MSLVWRHALNLSCGHEAEVRFSGHSWVGVFSDLPVRKDGWPKARRCEKCAGVRRVLSMRHQLDPVESGAK